MKVYPFVCIHERNEVINMNEKTFNDVVNHMKTSGFVYQGSEIYGGLANTWDFGPLGIELKNNIKNAWWKRFIQESEHNVGLQSAILMNPNVWVASGHVGGFSDPLMDCKECKSRFRADQLIEEASNHTVNCGGMSNEDMENYIAEHEITCPKCGAKNFTNIRQFNLMFKTFQGVLEDAKVQSIYVLKLHRVSLSTLKTYKEQCVKNYHLVLDRLVKASVTKLHQVTSFSVLVNSNRWNWNSSVNLELI